MKDLIRQENEYKDTQHTSVKWRQKTMEMVRNVYNDSLIDYSRLINRHRHSSPYDSLYIDDRPRNWTKVTSCSCRDMLMRRKILNCN